MSSSTKGRWVALITGIFSIAIGLIYLLLITLLDSRGPMIPPPVEAFGVVEALGDDYVSLEAPQPSLVQLS